MDISDACTLYIVRHGQTEWNISGLLQGHLDSPLTPEGIGQARALASAFRNIPFDAVFSSDLLRARRTASMIVWERELAVQTTVLLRERSFGPYDGKHRDIYRAELREMLDMYGSLPDLEKPGFSIGPGIETDASMTGRFLTFIRQISAAYAGKKVLVVTHGGMLRILLIHLGYGTYARLPHGSVGNTGYAIVRSDGVEFAVDEVHGVTLKTA